MNFNLLPLGWDEFFQSQIDASEKNEFIPARVIAENKTNYKVSTVNNEFIAEVIGRLIYATETESDLPKVGDWVLISLMDIDRAMIHGVLRRKTKLSRKAVGKDVREQIVGTNLDVLFIVQSLDSNFNLSRAERYLATLDREIRPVLVLNKTDLCDDVPAKLAEVKRRLPSLEVIATSAVNDQVDNLRKYISAGQTFAFIGSSGVGKSSLINRLMNDSKLETAPVRETDSKGRHTTTRREIVILESGGVLMDTPGMREFEPWGGDVDSEVFSDIEKLATQCRFKDCRHIQDEGCAVKQAVDDDVITFEHYQNFLKLERELEYQRSKTDINAALAKKNEVKKIHRAIKQMKKRKDE
jgi:ribosome biogenesis GTPase / thiamine phosphate phosphatase